MSTIDIAVQVACAIVVPIVCIVVTRLFKRRLYRVAEQRSKIKREQQEGTPAHH